MEGRPTEVEEKGTENRTTRSPYQRRIFRKENSWDGYGPSAGSSKYSQRQKFLGLTFRSHFPLPPPKVTNAAVQPSHSRSGMGDGIEPWPLSHHAVPRIAWDQRGSLPLLVCPLSALHWDREEQKSSLAIPFPSRSQIQILQKTKSHFLNTSFKNSGMTVLAWHATS